MNIHYFSNLGLNSHSLLFLLGGDPLFYSFLRFISSSSNMTWFAWICWDLENCLICLDLFDWNYLIHMLSFSRQIWMYSLLDLLGFFFCWNYLIACFPFLDRFAWISCLIWSDLFCWNQCNDSRIYTTNVHISFHNFPTLISLLLPE